MQLDFDLKGTPKKAKNQPAQTKALVAEEPKVFTVTALTRKIRLVLEGSLGDIWVEGEISNLRRQSSGHLYFTLKDNTSQLACVMFAGQTAQLHGMKFADGVQVQVFGQLTVYEPRGNYQLIVRRVQARGVGALQAKFEELKTRLQAEGLFSSERKRPLPRYPRRIAVVTSPTGAAIRDFLHVLHRRQRGIAVLIYPVRVQGNGAASEISDAIRSLGNPAVLGIDPPDVIVVTRGGGSLEDLWEFNEESVARAIADSPIPVVSAVGHEIDFTISDFAADFRAPTPSAAAEVLSADSTELLERLSHLGARLKRPVHSRLESMKTQLRHFERTALFLEPRRLLREYRQTLDRQLDDLNAGAATALQSRQIELERFANSIALRSPARRIREIMLELSTWQEAMQKHLGIRHRELATTLDRHSALLNALNPTAALQRGYTITLDADGKILRSAADAVEATALITKFHDGSVKSKPLTH
jgi:exodeoxyribonuclease VII large subunit